MDLCLTHCLSASDTDLVNIRTSRKIMNRLLFVLLMIFRLVLVYLSIISSAPYTLLNNYCLDTCTHQITIN